jgi:serine-type D-Ala-D-Ala carboxypeptidase
VQHLDALLRQATQDGTIPGAVIYVGYQGQTVWQQAYGAAALVPTWRPMQRDTLFDIASLTKVVATTSLTLRAHHARVCRLDACLQRFYPALMHTTLGSVTLRQLLAHVGGLAAWQPFYQQLLPHGPALHDATSASRRRHQATCLILREPLAYTPGTRVVYSDLGFILLGNLLEAQYGQPLSTLFLDNVAQPLGLRHIAYRPFDQPSPLPVAPTAYAATEACPWRGRVLIGEVHDENAWAMGGIAGHAGLFATAEALGQFAQALLDTVAGKSDWLPAPLLQESWQRQPIPVGTTRALGWDTPTPGHSTAGAYFSSRSIGHLGFTGTSLWIDLERQVIVVLCTNRVHPSRQATGIQRLRPAVHNLVMQALGVAPS